MSGRTTSRNIVGDGGHVNNGGSSVDKLASRGYFNSVLDTGRLMGHARKNGAIEEDRVVRESINAKGIIGRLKYACQGHELVSSDRMISYILENYKIKHQ